MNPSLRITLFGRFSIRCRGKLLLGRAPQKAQELFAYLLLHRNRTHPRDGLAEFLWGETECPRSRKYLRQTLWQLQRGLLACGRRAANLIEQDPAWVRVGSLDGVWVDTVAFEAAYKSLHGLRRPLREATDIQGLAEAVQIYRGELLEGWYRPWCLAERDRFRELYLAVLERLTDHYESLREFDEAIAYARLELRCDRANERTQRTLMRLLFLAGDRTGALRQFELCRAALREELDVEPGEQTMELYAMIRGGPEEETEPTPTPRVGTPTPGHGSKRPRPQRVTAARKKRKS